MHAFLHSIRFSRCKHRVVWLTGAIVSTQKDSTWHFIGHTYVSIALGNIHAYPMSLAFSAFDFNQTDQASNRIIFPVHNSNICSLWLPLHFEFPYIV